MIAYVLQRPGQSIYDLCLQAYGTLDLLLKLCTDNGVTDMQDIPQQVNYAYDTTLVKYEGNPNIYVTDYAVTPEVKQEYVTEDKSAIYGGTGFYYGFT